MNHFVCMYDSTRIGTHSSFRARSHWSWLQTYWLRQLFNSTMRLYFLFFSLMPVSVMMMISNAIGSGTFDNATSCANKKKSFRKHDRLSESDISANANVMVGRGKRKLTKKYIQFAMRCNQKQRENSTMFPYSCAFLRKWFFCAPFAMCVCVCAIFRSFSLLCFSHSHSSKLFGDWKNKTTKLKVVWILFSFILGKTYRTNKPESRMIKNKKKIE